MKSLVVAVRMLLVLTLLTGILYPVAVTVIGNAAFQHEAKGNLIYEGETVVGSSLLAQGFQNPNYFWPRPSAINYDSASSGATNASPTSKALYEAIKVREQAGAKAEMRFASGSGLDPHLSPEAAIAQVTRISLARGFTPAQHESLEALVKRSILPRQFGVLGEERVNVLLLNLELKKSFSK